VPLCADSQANLKTVLSLLLSSVAPPAAPSPRSLAALCSASVEMGSERLLLRREQPLKMIETALVLLAS
jgi:hypothetical protein